MTLTDQIQDLLVKVGAAQPRDFALALRPLGCEVKGVQEDNAGVTATIWCPPATASEVMAPADGTTLTPEPGPEEEMSLVDGLAYCLAPETPNTDIDKMQCAAYMASQPDDPQCPDHLVMLTQAGCPFCQEAKSRYAGLLQEGVLQDVDIATERGKILVDLAKLDFTPSLIVVGCNDNLRAVLANPLHPRLTWREDGGQVQAPTDDDG